MQETCCNEKNGMKNLCPERKLILKCCSIRPEKNRIKELLSARLDWNYILKTSTLHGVAGFVFRNTSEITDMTARADPYYKQLKKQYHKTAYKNFIFKKEFEIISSRFSSEGISLIGLKGISFLQDYYVNPGLRSLSDIDILVEEKNMAVSGKLLVKMGYQRLDKPGPGNRPHFHTIYRKRGGAVIITVELHRHVDFETSPWNISIEDLWNRSEPADPPSCRRLCTEDRLIFNCFHIFRDGVKAVFLKNLCDISEIIKRSSIRINWRSVVKYSEQYGIMGHVCLSLMLVQKLFNTRVPPELSGNHDKRDISFLIAYRVFFPAPGTIHIPDGFIELASLVTPFNKRKNSRVAIKKGFTGLLSETLAHGRGPGIKQHAIVRFAGIIKSYGMAVFFLIFHPLKFRLCFRLKKNQKEMTSGINSRLKTQG